MHDTGARSTIALVASLLLHLGGLMVYTYIVRQEALAAAAFTPPDPDEIRPGIERSNAATVTWIGFEEPTPHSAPLSETDQAALAPDPQPPVAQQTPQPAPPTPPAAEATPQGEPIAEQPTGRDARDPNEQRGAPTEQPTPPAKPAQTPTSQPAPASPKTSDPVEKALPAEKESSAFSAERRIEFDDIGKPLAVEGLDITTVRPKWSHYVKIMTRPHDPLLEVVFSKEGVVVEAKILESSGRADVDEPLLDAAYQWTARGKALDELPITTPPERITMRFQVGLR